MKQELNPEEIRRLYWDEQKTTRELSEIFHEHHPTIISFMIRNNIPRRNRSEAHAIRMLKNPNYMQKMQKLAVQKRKDKRKLDPDEVRRSHWEEALTLREIAERFGYNPNNSQVISDFMHKHNIPIRSNHDPIYQQRRHQSLKEKQMSEIQPQPQLEIQTPTTTRGKTIEALEVKREAEFENPIQRFKNHKFNLKAEYEELNNKFNGLANQIQAIEQQNRDAVIPSIRKQINKSKMVTLELEQQEISGQRTEKINQINDLNFSESLVENIIAFKELSERTEEINRAVASLNQISSDMTRISKAILKKIMAHHGLDDK